VFDRQHVAWPGDPNINRRQDENAEQQSRAQTANDYNGERPL
jgi:hypothetical protein